MRILIFALLAVVAMAYEPSYDDKHKLREAMAVATGYKLEIHYVTTGDGSKLSVCRIYKGTTPPPVEDKKVVILHPGVQGSSVDWVILKEKSLVYMLAFAGYDVWILNPRGNLFSKFNKYYNSESYKYWDFGWYEMGVIDLPYVIDYILKITLQVNLYFIGQGQGVTAFMVMLAELPEYNDKIINAQLMSPLVFFAHMRSPLKLLAYLFIYPYQSYEFAEHGSNATTALRAYCKRNDIDAETCLQVFFFFAGADPDQIDHDWLNEILKYWPAGTSSQTYTHFAQLIHCHTNKFQYYQQKPCEKVREFDLSKVTALICIYAGKNDPISTVEDSKTLLSKLSNKKCQEVVEIGNNFSHMAFPWGKKADVYLYRQLMDNML